MPRGRLPKYAPLQRYLAGQPTGVVTVTLSVPAVAALVGERLPSSAATAAWWVNTRYRSQGRAWLDVGWRVARFNYQTGAVTFVRVAATDQPRA
jgi:hypothetical protein